MPLESCNRHAITSLAWLVVVLLIATQPAAASVVCQQTGQPEQPDSQAVLKEMRAAQSRFERIRRSNLPYASGTGGGRCDANVGRFCYWYDDDDSWQQPDEHAETTGARERLLQRLDSAAAVLPGDRWILGQRVRYLIEAERLDSALRTTRSCQAEDWWCRALEGYVLHVTGEYAGAEAAFDASMAVMSHEQECKWRNIALLLAGKQRGRYEELDCTERADFERRFWWLSDPLFAVAGNERRTEHFSRVVVANLLAESASPRSIPWRSDNVELLYRYGRIVGWQRRYASRLSTGLDGGILGHHRSHSWRFEPANDHLADLSDLAPGDWDLEPHRPHTRYAAEYATDFRPLEHTLSLFRRDGSAVVVVRCEPPAIANGPTAAADSRSASWQSALALSASESDPVMVVRSIDCQPLVAAVPLAAAMISVEALSRADSVAARDRYWLDIPTRLGPAGRLTVSQIMPIQPVAQLPVDLVEAAPIALSSTRLAPGDEIGLYWEIYGLDPAWNSVAISLAVEKVGKGFLRRVGEWTGVVGKRSDQIRMQWAESVPATVTVNRAITVRLTPSMDGTYMIRLTVRSPTGQTAATSRLIAVEP